MRCFFGFHHWFTAELGSRFYSAGRYCRRCQKVQLNDREDGYFSDRPNMTPGDFMDMIERDAKFVDGDFDRIGLFREAVRVAKKESGLRIVK